MREVHLMKLQPSLFRFNNTERLIRLNETNLSSPTLFHSSLTHIQETVRKAAM